MKKWALLAFGLAFSPVGAHADTLVLIGTHGSGPGQGIFAASLNTETGAIAPLGLAAEIEQPVWLVRDPAQPILYAVSEPDRAPGGVHSFAIDRNAGRLHPLDHTESGGRGPTYVSYDGPSHTLFVAHYGSGQVATIPVGTDGKLGGPASVQANSGSGPNPRQAGPHAHSAVLDPSGHYILSPDLGADRVFVYHFDPASRALSPAATPFAVFPAGSGPRHLAFSPDGTLVYVDAELSSEVYGFRWDRDAGRLLPLTHVALDPPDFSGRRSAAEIAIAPDGRFLYVSNRGIDAIQVYSIDHSSGALTLVQRIECGGHVPWSFAIDPSGRWLLVTNEASSNLAVFAIDPATGQLTATANQLSVPRPVALAFVP
jgi:6-phosphogluconolactonase